MNLRDLIHFVANQIGCKSFSEKEKKKEQKNREQKKKVKERKNQRLGIVNDTETDDDDENEDLEIEYNVEENLVQLIDAATKYTYERYEDTQIQLMNEKERVNLLKEFVNFTRVEEDEREMLEKQNDPDAITITTIHGAKGLEWKHCFIVRANQGMMPITYRQENDTDQEYDNKEEHYEEERRLFYVALSRAKKTVSISYVITNEKDRPSVFLEQVAKEYVITDQEDSIPAKRNLVPNANTSRFTSINRPTLADNFPQQKSIVNSIYNRFNSKILPSNPNKQNCEQKNRIVSENKRTFKPVPLTLKPKDDKSSIPPVKPIQNTNSLNKPLKNENRKGALSSFKEEKAHASSERAKLQPSKEFERTHSNEEAVILLEEQSNSDLKRPRYQLSQKKGVTQEDDFLDGFLFEDVGDLFVDNEETLKKKPRAYM
jgi:ATP-dependent exoDNAse (exonuclease V) beta subunit